MNEGRSTAPPAKLVNGFGDAGSDKARRGPRVSVRQSFLWLLVLALVPLMLLALGRSTMQLERGRAMVEARLAERASDTARGQAEVVRTARAVLLLLSNQPDVRSGGILCDMALDKVAGGFGAFSNVSRFDAQGNLMCSSDNVVSTFSVAGMPWWPAAQSHGKFLVHGPIWGTASQRWVLATVQPLVGTDGRFDGVITISIDLAWMQRSLQSRSLAPDAVALVLDGQGRILVGSRPVRFGGLNVKLPSGSIGDATDAEGRNWTYAVAPLVSGRDGSRPLYVAYAMPEARLFSAAWWQAGLGLLQPLLAVALVSLVIWYGTNRLVLRWLGELHSLANAFSAGDYRARGDFDAAPAEFRTLAAAFYKMGQAINRRDSDLRAALDRQNLLIRETHHRVKNNLQIVMSLLSLQVDRLETVAGRAAMSQIRLRISTLALVHRLLYETGETALVSSTKLLGGVCDLLIQTLAKRAGIEVHCDFADYDIDIDTAIPLALWLTEATSNAMLHAFPPDRGGEIRLELRVIDGIGILDVIDNGIGFVADPGAAPTRGLRILSGIARQLGGTSNIDSSVSAGTRAQLRYPVDRALRLPNAA